MWMPPPVPTAPAWWQVVPVETAKPKQPEKVTTRCPSNITPQFQRPHIYIYIRCEVMNPFSSSRAKNSNNNLEEAAMKKLNAARVSCRS
jgi:hypothetical protein